MNERDELFELLYTRSFMYRDDPPFTLVSGKTSNYYFDCKATTLNPKGCYLLGRLMFREIEKLEIDALGGLTLGADPISLSISLAAYNEGKIVNPLIIRKESKKHGTQKWIEGDLAGVKRVVVVDDVITTGKSTIEALERMRESGLEVVRALVLVDRQEGGRERIEKMDVPVSALFTRGEFDRRRLV